MNTSITSFTHLIVWQKAHALVLMIYKLTQIFPRNEAFGLSAQIRRASISVTSNIAEGFGRKNAREKRQFYYFAKSSLTEAQNQLLVARDVGYIKRNEFLTTANLTVEVMKMLNKVITTFPQ